MEKCHLHYKNRLEVNSNYFLSIVTLIKIMKKYFSIVNQCCKLYRLNLDALTLKFCDDILLCHSCVSNVA